MVSYADSEYGHCGIIYQATNWQYTGSTVSHDHLYLVPGRGRVHPMTLRDEGITNPKEWARQNGLETVKPSPKHRYFTLLGNRYQKAAMAAKLIYSPMPYPKAPKVTYDDGPRLTVPAPSQQAETPAPSL